MLFMICKALLYIILFSTVLYGATVILMLFLLNCKTNKKRVALKTWWDMMYIVNQIANEINSENEQN